MPSYYEGAFSPEVPFTRMSILAKGVVYAFTQYDYLRFLRELVSRLKMLTYVDCGG